MFLKTKPQKILEKSGTAGLCDRLFELAKENLDERLMSDSLGLKADGNELSQMCKEDIVKAMDSMVM